MNSCRSPVFHCTVTKDIQLLASARCVHQSCVLCALNTSLSTLLSLDTVCNAVYTANTLHCTRLHACITATAQVGVGVLAPIAELERAPVPNAVAVVSLTAVAAAGGKVELPTGAMRVVITLTVCYYYCHFCSTNC
jgi:hypothetical protein